MSSRAAAKSWFDIPEARPALTGSALTMRAAWLDHLGPVPCDRCGRPILPGDRFRLTPYCPMGDRLDLTPEALTAFADTLEVAAHHTACEEGDRPAAWRLPVTPPFSLERTVRAFQRLPANETQLWRDGAFLRSLRLNGTTHWLRVTQPDPAALEIDLLDDPARQTPDRRSGPLLPDAPAPNPRRRVSYVQPGISMPAPMPDVVRWMLAPDCDLRPFAERAARFPRLRAVFDQLTGLRPPRFPDLFETLVNTLLFQQISLHAGTALLNRLARAFGETHTTPWGEVRRLPTAEEATEIPEAALTEIGFSRHKARALVALAREIAAGRLRHEALAALPTPELEQRLIALPGIGPWSARVIMLRGFGRLDTFPTGDSGAARTLRGLFEVSASDTEALQSELLAVLAPYQGFLYFCLLGWRLLQAGVLA